MANINENPEEEVVKEVPEQTANGAELTVEEQLKKELAEQNDKYLRLMAEYDNFRKRTTREKEALFGEAKAITVISFLAVLDNFELALKAETQDKEYVKGIEMIYQKFKETLTTLGVEEIGAVGEPFNPEYHNAVAHVEDESTTEPTVLEVFQKGYKVAGKLIRAAMVKVAN